MVPVDMFRYIMQSTGGWSKGRQRRNQRSRVRVSEALGVPEVLCALLMGDASPDQSISFLGDLDKTHTFSSGPPESRR